MTHPPGRLHRRAPEAAPPALRDRLTGISGPFRWVTFDTPQSRSLLDGEEVEFVPFVGGRDPATSPATCRTHGGS